MTTVGSISGIASIYAQPAASNTADAITQAQQTMNNSTSLLSSGSAYPSSTTDAGTYTYQMIYDNTFANAISSSNAMAQVSGSGKVIMPYADANEAVAAGNDTLNNSKNALLASLGSVEVSGSANMSSLILGSLYARNGFQQAMNGTNLNLLA